MKAGAGVDGPTGPMRRSNDTTGFTLVEALVVVALVGIVATVGAPYLQRLIHRGKLEGIARQTAIRLRMARLEAIKQSRPTALRIDRQAREMLALLDEDGDGQFAADEPLLGREPLPTGIDFTAPVDDPAPIAGFPTTSGGNVGQVTFGSDGSADAAGGIRLGDRRGNFLEVRVEPRTTARIEIRKWDGSAWRAAGEGGTPWRWH